jgi:cytochrome c
MIAHARTSMTRLTAATLLGTGLLIGASGLSGLSPASAETARKGDAELGQHLSSECVACHQESGKAQGVPAIVGWPDEQFVAVMLSYKNRERPNQIMQVIAGRLSQEEIEALAAWFGSKTPAK